MSWSNFRRWIKQHEAINHDAPACAAAAVAQHVLDVQHGGSAAWADITGKPATFPPDSHSHTKADVGLGNCDNVSDANKPVSTATQTALDGKANSSHTQAASTISDSTATGRAVLTAADAPAARTAIGAGTSSFDGAYGSLSGVPSTFAPSAHTHPAADISDSTATGRAVVTAANAGAARTAIGAGTSSFDGAYGSLSGVPSTFAPSAHASAHQSGGGDAIKLDDLAAPDDNTDLNASTSKHGLCPKFPGGTTTFLRADATFAAPPGGGFEFPVGYVLISVVNTNPATFLGYGTWANFGAGRVLVGLDSGDTDFDTVREERGSKTVTLTAAQSGLPAHGHAVTDPGHLHAQQRFPTATGGSTGFTVDTSMSGTPAAANNTASATTGLTVNNVNAANAAEAHSIVQPSFVAYFWERTA